MNYGKLGGRSSVMFSQELFWMSVTWQIRKQRHTWFIIHCLYRIRCHYSTFVNKNKDLWKIMSAFTHFHAPFVEATLSQLSSLITKLPFNSQKNSLSILEVLKCTVHGVIQWHFEPFWWFWAILGHFGAVLGHFGAPVGTWMAPGWSNMTYNHVIYPWEVF